MSNAIRNSFVALAAILAFAGTSFEAQAQKTNNSRTSSTGSTAGDNGGGRVLLLGQPGNCPPTIACPPQRTDDPDQPRRPRHDRIKLHCDTVIVESTGEVVKRCIER